MLEFLLGMGSAFAYGVWTSLTPCPLATNIAAISFIGKRIEKPRAVLLSGLLYTLGRAVTYVVLAIIIVSTLLASHTARQQAKRNPKSATHRRTVSRGYTKSIR